jgi:histidyl-tRNA synthetase
VAAVVSDAARAHVDQVATTLAALGIAVRAAPRLVRGLDYYLRTVFEVISPALGADTVICGGGRYDRLISDLGGPQVAGIGFAIGEDRLIEALPQSFATKVLGTPLVAVVPVGDGAVVATALDLARTLVGRGLEVRTEVTGRSLKAAFKWADKIAARAVVMVGADELARGEVSVKDLARGEQATVALAAVADHLQALLATG